MATYTVTTTPQQVASGTSVQRLVNNGSVPVVLTWGAGRAEVLFPGGPSVTRAVAAFAPGGAVMAYTTSGTASLDVTVGSTDLGMSGTGLVSLDDLADDAKSAFGRLDAGSSSIADRNTRALRYFRQRLAKRETSPCNIVLCPADSIGEGQGATVWGNAWINRFRDLMRTRYPVSGVSGGVSWVPPFVVGFSGAYTDPVTRANNPTNANQYGFGRKSIQLQSTGQTMAITQTMTACDVVWYRGGGGTFSWQLDGGAATNVATTGTLGPQVTRITPGSGGSHTVQLNWVSGNSIIGGFIVYNGDETKGIRTFGGGFAGALLNDFVTQSGGNANNAWDQYLPTFDPALVVASAGANEFKTAVAPSVHRASLVSALAMIRAQTPLASVLFHIEHELGGFTPVAPWADYVANYYSVAEADGNVAIHDMHQRLGPWAAAETLGIINVTDHQHPLDPGHLFYAEALAGFLSAA